MKIIKAIFTKLMFKSILHIITKKNNDEEFPKEINQNNHHGTIFAFFPFFSQHVSTKKQNTNSCFQRECGQIIEWIKIKYYQTNEREIEHVRFAAWQVFNKNAKKKIPKKRLISCLSLRSLKIFRSNPDSIKPWSLIEKFELTTHLSKGSVN